MSDTNVKVVDFENIEDLFGGVPSTSIITSEETPKTVLTQEEEPNLDPNYLDDKKKTQVQTVATDVQPVVTPGTEEAVEDLLDFDELSKQAEQDNKSAGRSKTDKSGLVNLYSKYIAEGKMNAFDDFDVEPTDPEYKTKLTEYLSKFSMNDFEELHEANISAKEREIEEKIPQEFFNNLPRELQFAAKYVADGGTDMKGLFKALSQVEEVRALDPKENPREVAEQYLKATNFGSDEEIKEQLDEWEDLNRLGQKAETFKPKLDKMQEQIVERKLMEQEQQKIQREQAAIAYTKNVQEALKVPELAGVKLDKKTHDFLTQGLLQPAYQSQITGQRTNLLGYLLEKHQMIEPNYQLVAEALWLLSDPDAYRAKLIEKGDTQRVAKTVRELKGVQQSKIASTSIEEDNNEGRSVKKGLPRPSNVLRR